MKIIAAFMAGCLVVGLIAYVICGIESGVQKLEYMGAMEHPLTIMFADLEGTVSDGKYDLAKAKLLLLGERWEAYSSGGPSPSAFYLEIVNLSATSR